MTTTYTIGNLTNSSNTITITGSGSSGSGYTIGTGTTTVPLTWTTTGTGTNWVSPVLTVQEAPAGLEVKGKVTINGLDLEERLKTIERVLMIPERDVTMEAKYPSLKKKYDEYIKALEKYRMWDAIKGDDE